MKIITPNTKNTIVYIPEKDKYTLIDTMQHSYLFSHFIKRISFSKWNWSKRKKLTIDSYMNQDDLKKFLDSNGVKPDGELNTVSKVVIIIEIKEK